MSEYVSIDAEDYDNDDDYVYLSRYGWVLKAVEKNVILQKSTGPLTYTQSLIIDSCLARGDREKAEIMIQDWE